MAKGVAGLVRLRARDTATCLRACARRPGCAPQNLLGLMAAFGTSGERCATRGAWRCDARAWGVGAALPRLFGQDAVTLGMFTFVNGDPGPRLLAHEYRHYQQSLRWGLRFLPSYLIAAARVRGDHDRNRFEQDAEAYARVHPWAIDQPTA